MDQWLTCAILQSGDMAPTSLEAVQSLIAAVEELGPGCRLVCRLYPRYHHEATPWDLYISMASQELSPELSLLLVAALYAAEKSTYSGAGFVIRWLSIPQRVVVQVA